jgi:NAD(P)-dependent dehydrogenase (short-subunit alcohol dehydrogenase family)
LTFPFPEANYLGPALFTELLVDNLAQAGGARVLHTSSGAHQRYNGGFLKFEDIPVAKESFTINTYGLTKLLQIMYAKDCQRVWGGKGITSFSFHPGFVGTNFGSNSTIGQVVMAVLSPAQRTIDQGASTGLYCALNEDAMKFPGGYFDSNAHKELPPQQVDPELCKRVRDSTLQWIKHNE